jgi:hypothetical protein
MCSMRSKNLVLGMGHSQQLLEQVLEMVLLG